MLSKKELDLWRFSNLFGDKLQKKLSHPYLVQISSRTFSVGTKKINSTPKNVSLNILKYKIRFLTQIHVPPHLRTRFFESGNPNEHFFNVFRIISTKNKKKS
jgi:hypothetical protein